MNGGGSQPSVRRNVHLNHPTPWPPPLQGAGESDGASWRHTLRVCRQDAPFPPLSLRERGGRGGEGVWFTQKVFALTTFFSALEVMP